ncbi:MAG: hypothetical protein QM702_08070 [Rubrivivax sp.]
MRARQLRERRLARMTTAGVATARTAAPNCGVLRIGGPGAEAVGVGPFYAPADATFSAQGPNCVGGACSSVLQLSWTRSPCVLLMVTLMSTTVGRPGAVPGTQINGVGLSSGPGRFGANGLDFIGVGEPFSPAALGITLDREARTLSFHQTRVPAWPGGPEVVLDGTLHF